LESERKENKRKKERSDLLVRLEEKKEAVFNGKKEWGPIKDDKFFKGRMQLLYTIVFRISITSRIIVFGHETESCLIFTDTF
jgi:hypothetical protein